MKRSFRLISKYECKEESVIKKLNNTIESVLKDTGYDSWESFITNEEKDTQKSIGDQIEYSLRATFKQYYKYIPNLIDCLGDDLLLGYDDMKCKVKVIQQELTPSASSVYKLFIYFTTYEYVLFDKIGSRIVFRDHIDKRYGTTRMLDFEENPVQFWIYEIN